MEDRLIRKHFSFLGWTFLLGIAMIFVFTLIMQKICIEFPQLMVNADLALIISMSPMYLLGMPALIWAVKRVPAVTLPRHSMKISHFLLCYIICVPLMYGSNIVGLIITSIIGILKGSPVQNAVDALLGETHLGLIFLFTVIIAPLYEEYIFRRLIVDRTVKYGKAVAVVLSGVMFGLFHGNLNQFVYATVLGMFFAFVYVNTGKLRYSVGLHMLVNFMGGTAGAWLLRQINLDELVLLEQAGATEEELLAAYMQNLPGLLMVMAFFLLIVCLGVAGLVLLVLYRRRFILPRLETDIPKGKAWGLVLCNSGMMCYCVFWIVKIIHQLLWG